MTATSKTLAFNDLLRACVPLGIARESGGWSPLGAGTLVYDAPLLWLATAKNVVQRAPAGALAAWVGTEGGGTVLEFSATLRDEGLGWIEAAEEDLAISIFPAIPGLDAKAFGEARCLGSSRLKLLMPVCAIGCPYNVEGVATDGPSPIMLPGTVAGFLPPTEFYTTAPLLPANNGAPLLQLNPESGDVALAGLLTRAARVPERSPEDPSVRLSLGLAASSIWKLIRSETAKAQRELVVSRSAPAPVTPVKDEANS